MSATRLIFGGVVIAMGLAACTPPDPIVVQRHENRKTAERMVLALKAELERGSNLGIVEARVRDLIALQREFVGLFPEGTNRGSLALPSVWRDRPGFERASMNAIASAERLAEVARSGNSGATIEALYEYAKTCGACHERYKAAED